MNSSCSKLLTRHYPFTYTANCYNSNEIKPEPTPEPEQVSVETGTLTDSQFTCFAKHSEYTYTIQGRNKLGKVISPKLIVEPRKSPKKYELSLSKLGPYWKYKDNVQVKFNLQWVGNKGKFSVVHYPNDNRSHRRLFAEGNCLKN